MKNFSFLIISIIFSLGLISFQSNFLTNQKVECENSKLFGNTEICLPEIDEMYENYLNPIVKENVDSFSNKNTITILAVYINKSDNSRLNKFENPEFDDYFKIYGLNKLKNKFIDLKFFKVFKEIIKNNFVKTDWKSIESKFSNNINDIKIEKPIQIEIYYPNDSVVTIVMLNKIKVNNNELIGFSTLNYMFVKNSIINFSYYKIYDGPKTIENVKLKNDYLAQKILSIN